ncbi:hypothetical protein Mic7113_6529 (plasmid) [Allocoleopsis franciscana PCC 7113]|uniref:Uncharacterized protein n=1 Tax=Allocoleopsis franciscana PCC 7113 TaxID=1173027 RepID=K9WRE6_9CYAN|nr:hypothetical protein Mic7113_6529 [Allocoleopsis franciscana PCC 7113]
MKAPTQLRTERGYLKDMKLSVLHSTPRPGRITSLASPNETQANLKKQIGRSPIKDLPINVNVMYTLQAIALAIVLSYRHFYRRHFQCHDTRYVGTHAMSLQMHTLCHFKCTRNATSNKHVMSLQINTLCHFKCTRYVTSNAHVMSAHTLCHFQCTRYITSNEHIMLLQMHTQCHNECHFKCTRYVSIHVMSLPMYTIIPLFDYRSSRSNQQLELISNLYTVNQGGK